MADIDVEVEWTETIPHAMEKLETGKCVTSGLLSLQPRRSSTVNDIPYDCKELIMDNLALVDHYKGWDCLMKPLSMRASPFKTQWFLEKVKISRHIIDNINSRPVSTDPGLGVAIQDCVSLDLDAVVNGHCCCRLLFSEPITGKKQKISLNLDTKTPCGGIEERNSKSGKIPVFATDKGLLVMNLHENVRFETEKRNRHNNDRFLILNLINNSMSILPPIPGPLCRCRFPDCFCKATPLKLIVQMGQTDGLKTTQSSYKAYILECKLLPRSLRRNCKDTSSHFRVIAYDSLTKLWQRTGVDWRGKACPGMSMCASVTKIFPMSNGIFYISTGSFWGPDYYETLNVVLYKYQEGILIGKVKAPFKRKEEDRYCEDHPPGGHGILCSCGCISTHVFEDAGKIFFFQQTSWLGDFGPNCISARMWELNDREMIWHPLCVLPPHRFEFCPMREMGKILDGTIFTYEGMLLVVHGHLSNNKRYGVAGFDFCKRTWCKVPKDILEHLPVEEFCGQADLDRNLFQPNADTRA